MINNKWLVGLVIVAMFGMTACDDYLDINENPNTATEAPLDGLLSFTSYQTALNQYRVARFTSFFVQYLAGPNPGGNSDTYIESDYSGTWGEVYETLTDLYDLQQLGLEKNAFQHIAAAKVMTAINLGLLIDCWNDVPYSDAFTGNTITPSYDGAEGLYGTVFSLLTEAENEFDDPKNDATLGADSDFIHGGDIDAWKRTIAAVRARYLNHLSGTGQYDATAILAAVDAAYTSSADDAQMSTFNIRNPWADVAQDNENLVLGGWFSEQYIDALNGTTFGVVDPRLALIATQTVNGDYRGTVNGQGRIGDGTDALESYLATDGALSSEDSPIEVVTFHELKFIEAEAALRSNNPDRALTALQAGVSASINKLFALTGQDGTDAANTYLMEAHGDLTANSIDLDVIFREKYAAMVLSPETWVDARRFDYGYQDFELPVGANLSEFIRRVQYPETELVRNGANAPIVNLTDRIFWDN